MTFFNFLQLHGGAPAKRAKMNLPSEGAAEGGCGGGNSAVPERSAEAPARRSLGAGGKRRRSVVRIDLVKSSDFVQEGQPSFAKATD